MARTIEVIHTADRDPSINLPYAPAVKVTGGSLLFLAGVTAAKTYHHHPHIPEEFADVPDGMASPYHALVQRVTYSGKSV